MRATYFQLLRLCVAIALCGIASGAAAGGPDIETVPASPSAQPPAKTVQNLFFCPPISALKKDPETRLWYATVGWKSYDLSFVDKITRFSGAQWRGTNVGQIFCVYRGEEETSFPVVLAYKILAYTPQGGQWSANLGGYANCETPSQNDCPFSIRVQAAPMDMYQQAEQLKRQAAPASRPGF
jgi:hypothetical protein